MKFESFRLSSVAKAEYSHLATPPLAQIWSPHSTDPETLPPLSDTTSGRNAVAMVAAVTYSAVTYSALMAPLRPGSAGVKL